MHTTAQKRTVNGLIKNIEMDVIYGTSVIELLDQLELSINKENILVVIDHKAVSMDYILQEGDSVQIIPAISGG